jgi:hypothetical protein
MLQYFYQGENGDNDLQKQKGGLQTVCKSIFPGFSGNQLLLPLFEIKNRFISKIKLPVKLLMPISVNSELLTCRKF